MSNETDAAVDALNAPAPAAVPPAVPPAPSPAAEAKPQPIRGGFKPNPNAEARPKATALPPARDLTSEGRKERQKAAAEAAAKDPRSLEARKARSPQE